jgi:hypothetical protein
MANEAKQPSPTPKYGFLLDELHRQGFLVGVGDVLKVHRYFKSLWEGPLSIGDLKAQLAALICHTPQDQKLFYAWFDKWAVVIERRTENLIAQLEPLEKATEATIKPPVDTPKLPTETPPPPPSTPQSQATNDVFMPSSAQKKRKGPINIQLAFPPNPIRFWNLAEFDAVLPVLREKKWVESTEWDIRASIRQTILSGGMPKFVFKQKRQTPQYLMLIEQQSNRDHLAAFYADLAEELSRRDLNVSFYYYDITPATCWRERNNPRTHVSLEQLQGEYADARLFIVGNAETLLKPTQLEPSFVAMSIWETWKETAVLSPKGTGDWGRGELAIGQLFPVIPANGLGFQSLSAQWQGSEHFTPTYWQLKNPEPRTPNVADFIVSERPEDKNTEGSLSLPSWKTITPDDESQLNLLYFYLRDGGYRWLCAAALYPEIYYELTRLYADEVIAKDQALSEWEQNRLWGESLRLLLRLDWFRKGQIPTHWRGLLRDDFSIERALALQNPQFELSVKEVRRQLLEVLKLPQNTEGVPEDSYAAANQVFTQVWIESEMANNLKEIPQKMEDLQISMSDIEDAVGQQLWFVEGQKMEAGYTKRAKTLYAVIVGIDRYAMSSLQLAGCRNDANAMNDYLKAFCAANAIVYSNKILFDEQAKRLDIIDSFTYFDQAQDGDICIFYFAGRGAQMPAPPEFTDEPDGMSETLLCYDSRTDNQNGRELADKELAYLIYKATQNKNVHFLSITDACHSGEENTRTKKKPTVAAGLGIKAEDYLGFEEYINYQPPAANYIHFGAAQSHETTKEVQIADATRGAFTFALVKILEEIKGHISYKDLLSRVKEDVKKRVSEQTPTLSAHGLSFETPFLGIKPKDEKQISEADPLSKKPNQGRLLFDMPKKMEVGKEYRCVVRIAHDDTPLFQNMEHTTNTAAQDIRIADVMSVELIDIDTETAFTIRTVTEAQQFIDDKEMTEWLFYIKPLKENPHSLALKVAVIEPIDGKERRREQVLEEMIEVTRAAEGKKAIINVESASLYEEPNTYAKVVGTRVRGVEVLVFEESNNWARIGDNMWVETACLGLKVKGLDNKTKSAIRDLVAKAQLNEAIETFQNWANTEGLEKELKDTLALLRSQYLHLEDKENKGVFTPEQLNIERNRITNALLNIANDNEIETIVPFNTPSVLDDKIDVTMEVIRGIRELISKNKIGEAFVQLQHLKVRNNEIENNITILQASYKNLQDQRTKDVITNEGYQLENQRILHGILDLLSNIET